MEAIKLESIKNLFNVHKGTMVPIPNQDLGTTWLSQFPILHNIHWILS